MFPTLFDSAWFGVSGDLAFRIPSYFAAIMLGYGLAVFLGWREVREWGMARQKYLDWAFWMLIIGVLGARMMHVFVDGLFWDYVHLCTDVYQIEGKALASGLACSTNESCLAAQGRGLDIGGICRPEDGLCYPQYDCFRWLKFWAGGLTIYGAVLACVVAGWLYTRKHQMPALKMLDLGGFGIPLGIAFGRIGCFLAGCCFGALCELDSISVQFPQGSSAYQHHFEHHYEALNTQWRSGVRTSLPVWPAQLISSAYNFVIFGVVYFFVRKRKRFDGQLILSFAILYAIARFCVEFIRADQRGGIGALSTSQIVAILTLAAALWLWGRWSKTPLESPAPD